MTWLIIAIIILVGAGLACALFAVNPRREDLPPPADPWAAEQMRKDGLL